MRGGGAGGGSGEAGGGTGRRPKRVGYAAPARSGLLPRQGRPCGTLRPGVAGTRFPHELQPPLLGGGLPNGPGTELPAGRSGRLPRSAAGCVFLLRAGSGRGSVSPPGLGAAGAAGLEGEARLWGARLAPACLLVILKRFNS